MGKNRRYTTVYRITFTGTTTNGSKAKFMHEILMVFLKAAEKYTTVLYKVLETEGDFNADTGETNEL